MVLGDFNEILLAEEKQGGLDRPEWQMLNFREALDFCSLKDLGFNGFPSLGAIRDRVTTIHGFSLIGELLQLIGSFASPLSESTI